MTSITPSPVPGGSTAPSTGEAIGGTPVHRTEPTGSNTPLRRLIRRARLGELSFRPQKTPPPVSRRASRWVIALAVIALGALGLTLRNYFAPSIPPDARDAFSEAWLPGAHRTWHQADVSDLPVISGQTMLTIAGHANGTETLTSWNLAGRWPERTWDLSVDRRIGVRTPALVGESVAVGNIIIDAKKATVAEAPWKSDVGKVDLVTFGSVVVSCEGEECTAYDADSLTALWSAPRADIDTLRPGAVDSSIVGVSHECASFNARTGEKRQLGQGESCRTLPVTNGFLVLAASDTSFDVWVYTAHGTRTAAHHEDAGLLDARTLQIERVIAGYFAANAYSASVETLKELVDALPNDPKGLAALSSGLLSNSITGIMGHSPDSHYLLGAGMRSKRWFARPAIFDTQSGEVVEWSGFGGEDSTYYQLVSDTRVIAFSPTSGVTVYEAGK